MKNITKILLTLVICIVAAVLGNATYQGSSGHKSHNNRYSTNNRYTTDKLDTGYASYKMRSTGNNMQVTTHDNITGAEHTYNIDTSNKPSAPNISTQQKRYLAQNKELVLQASKVYGFIALNDYRLVKFCSKYYPVKKFKQKYDNRFKEKRLKAENILENAYGVEGSASLKKSIMSNSDVLRVLYQQVEDDYQAIRGMAAQDGIRNFSRQDYCKLFEDSADEAVEQEYQKFKMMAPGF